MHHCTVDEIAALGTEINRNQYRIVRLAARYDRELDWHREGFSTPGLAIAQALDIHTSTAREWIRVGHALDHLPRIHDAFLRNELSYAKTRILTRWAEPETEEELLEIAHERSANRLTTAVAKHLARDEDEEARDQRQHDERSLTVHTDANGMVIIRAALPPHIGKPVAAALTSVVRQVAATPLDPPQTGKGGDEPDTAASADAPRPRPVAEPHTQSGRNASADAPPQSLRDRLRSMQRRQPAEEEAHIPSMAQQRADAFTLLFLDRDVQITTEVVIHVRGDGTTFDDGTPITSNAVCRQLDESFIRMLIHDPNRRPIDATNRRRHPTARQKRVVLEAHNHECVDCQSTELLELDHNPSFDETRHTVTTELEPRCAPCHRARHDRHDLAAAA